MNATNLEKDLRSKLIGKVVVVGVGNPLRCDDGAGSTLARRLKPLLPDTTFDCQTAPENFTGPIAQTKPHTVVIVDSSDWGAPAGTVRVLDPSEVAETSASTHALSLRHFARTVSDRTGCSIIVLAIQVGDASFGESLSPPVEAAVTDLVSTFKRLLIE